MREFRTSCRRLRRGEERGAVKRNRSRGGDRVSGRHSDSSPKHRQTRGSAILTVLGRVRPTGGTGCVIRHAELPAGLPIHGFRQLHLTATEGTRMSAKQPSLRGLTWPVVLALVAAGLFLGAAAANAGTRRQDAAEQEK